MNHPPFAAAAILLQSIVEHRKIGVANTLGEAGDLMLVLKEKDRLPLPGFGKNDG